MNDGGRTEESLEQELRALGPLMLRQERLEAEAPDALFASRLRARLVGPTAMPARAPVEVGRVGESGARPAESRPRPIQAWRRRPVPWIGVVAAVLAGLFVSGAPQHAWAALRQLLYYVPFVGTGQVESTALVADSPRSANNGALTLTVTGVVVGRHATLVSYQARGAALGGGGATATVADALTATLDDGAGYVVVPLSWVPARRGVDHGIPTIRSLMIFPTLPLGTRQAYLRVARLPDAPPAPRGWTLALPLHPVTAGGAQSSAPIDRSATIAGIQLAVTDLTRTGDATVADMSATIQGGPYSGGTITSLAPEQAVGAFAPVLSTGSATFSADKPVLPAPVRSRVLPRPEFIYPAVPRQTQTLSLTVPAVAVQEQGQATLTIPVGPGRRMVTLGRTALTIASKVVTPPAALGLDGARQLQLTLGFPAAATNASLQSVDVVVDGVSQAISRDDPTVDLPLTPGQRDVRVVVENPVVTVNGPWIIKLAP